MKESQTTEFKLSWQNKYFKWVCAFANTDGGKLIIGLDDKEEFDRLTVYFYKDIYTEENLRKLGLSVRQIKAALYVKENGVITNKEYRSMFGITDRMALIYLSSLCYNGILQKIGTTGRGTKYVLCKTRNKPEINPKYKQEIGNKSEKHRTKLW